MKERAFDVQALTGGAPEHPRRPRVHNEPHQADSQHQRALHLRSLRETPIGLHEYPNRDQPQRQCVQECRDNLASVKSIGAAAGRRTGCQPHCQQGKSYRSRIREHVTRVGKQGQTPGGKSTGDLHHHIAGNQHQRNPKASPAPGTPAPRMVACFS